MLRCSARERGVRVAWLPLLAALAMGIPAPSAGAAPAAAASAAVREAQRAGRTYQTLQRAYYLPKAKLYRGVATHYSYLWPFSQVMSATIAEIIATNDLARQIRDVAVEDLLGRKPVQLEQARISAKLRGLSEMLYDVWDQAQHSLLCGSPATVTEAARMILTVDFRMSTSRGKRPARRPGAATEPHSGAATMIRPIMGVAAVAGNGRIPAAHESSARPGNRPCAAAASPAR